MSSSVPDQSASPIEVFLVFLRLGLTSFGGPVAHLGYFQRELVVKRQWLDTAQYSSLLALCQFLPGPASSQAGFALGLLRAGWAGALAAFVGFTLPSALLMLAAALLFEQLTPEVTAPLIHGLKLVAAVVVADAVWSMAGKLCPDTPRRLLALLAALLLVWQSASVWLTVGLVVAGALLGMWQLRHLPTAVSVALPLPYGRRLAWGLLLVFVLLLAGLPLVAGLAPWLGLADSFYRAGALVLGGGHVVLPLLEQELVVSGQVSASEFLTGYGLAQAMPGPLFTFAAWLGALAGALSLGPVGGAVLALLALFLPGFLLLLAVLPGWFWLVQQPRVWAAVAGANAVVVGILLAALLNPVLVSALGSVWDGVIILVGCWWLMVRKGSSLWLIAGCVTAAVVVPWLTVF